MPLLLQAIRALLQLSSSDEVKLRVCEKAVTVATAGHISSTGSNGGQSNRVQQPYPASELHWLWTYCFNAAVASAAVIGAAGATSGRYLELASTLADLYAQALHEEQGTGDDGAAATVAGRPAMNKEVFQQVRPTLLPVLRGRAHI